MSDLEKVPIRRTHQHLVLDNPYLQVFDDAVVHSDGRRDHYLRAQTPGPGDGVVIVPQAGELLALVLTYRYATEAWEWGFPRGYAHSADAAESARAELREETGLVAEELTLLGRLHPNSGLLSDQCAVFLARVPASEERVLDTAEVHDIMWCTYEELMLQVAEGELLDAFTLSALTFLRAWGRV